MDLVIHLILIIVISLFDLVFEGDIPFLIN